MYRQLKIDLLDAKARLRVSLARKATLPRGPSFDPGGTDWWELPDCSQNGEDRIIGVLHSRLQESAGGFLQLEEE